MFGPNGTTSMPKSVPRLVLDKVRSSILVYLFLQHAVRILLQTTVLVLDVLLQLMLFKFIVLENYVA